MTQEELAFISQRTRKDRAERQKLLGNNNFTPATTVEKTAAPSPRQSTKSKPNPDLHSCLAIARHPSPLTALVSEKAQQAARFPYPPARNEDSHHSVSGDHMANSNKVLLSFLASMVSAEEASGEPELPTPPRIMRPSKKLGLLTHLAIYKMVPSRLCTVSKEAS